MAVSTRPTKKRKPSASICSADSGLAQLRQVEKSDGFWIHDGNMILMAPTKQYRLHRGVLAMHSNVFKDMFSIPQPGEQQTLEGAPVVEVTDCAKDWDELLPVIYGLKSVYLPVTALIPAPLMIAMLRLGKKYDCKRFKNQALDQLQAFLPDSLERWDALFNESLYPLQDALADDTFELVNVAVELHIRRVLPVAFLICIREFDLGEILAGRANLKGIHIVLPLETRHRLALGKEALARVAAEKSMAWFLNGQTSDKCHGEDKCSAVMWSLLGKMIKLPLGSYALNPPKLKDIFGALCGPCAKEAKAEHYAGQLETFSALPSYFGLES